MNDMTIYLGADHRGYQLKADLTSWLREQGHQVEDLGNTEYDPDDDFPDFAFPVAEKVAAQPESRGIVICGSGVGVSVAANKVAGIRSVLALTPQVARLARRDDDINVLALASDLTDVDQAKEVVTAFLSTAFDDTPRRRRRLEKIEGYGS